MQYISVDSVKNILINKLDIFIITYNRSLALSSTLDSLLNSPFSKCQITILNNKSTDDTIAVGNSYISKFSNLHIITNKINIGANANILRAFELSNLEYTWVLCDDDFYDFSYVADVAEIINEGKIELLHVGAHPFKDWKPSGIESTPLSLIEQGYPFYLFSSFLPCNIFKTISFQNQIVDAYENIKNWYPHMPFIIRFYTENKKIYVSKNRIVTASTGTQSYSFNTFFKAWFMTSYYLKTLEQQRFFLVDQLNYQSEKQAKQLIINSAFNVNIEVEYHLRFFILFPFEYTKHFLSLIKRKVFNKLKMNSKK